MTAKRILIVDPHPVIADSLSLSLGQYSTFTTESCSAYAETATRVGVLRPDLIVLNVYQENVAESLETCRASAAVPGSQMIVLLAPRDLVEQDTFTLDAVEAGADGVLIREEIDLPGLVAKLQNLETVRGLLDPRRLREALATRRALEPAANVDPIQEKLTPRERDVADLIMQGKTTGEIAEQLAISERTVQTHISNILAKLHVRTRAEAAIQLYQWRLAAQSISTP